MILIVVSTGHFDALLRECACLSERYDFFGQIGSSQFEPPFPFIRMGTPAEIETKMREAELVISHAGTGMLSQLYRLRKPSIVIPKQPRYGYASDEQMELAAKWAEIGAGLLCLGVEEIGAAIEKAKRFPFQFSARPSLGQHLREVIAGDLGLTSKDRAPAPG